MLSDEMAIERCYLKVVDLYFSVDHSRVHLSMIDEIPGSDYINANFCDVSTMVIFVYTSALLLCSIPSLKDRTKATQVNQLFELRFCNNFLFA